MKKLLLAVAALAIAAPSFAGTGGNPKPQNLLPGTEEHWGGDHGQSVAKNTVAKPAKPDSRKTGAKSVN